MLERWDLCLLLYHQPLFPPNYTKYSYRLLEGALVVGGLLLTTGLGIGYSALYSFMKMMLLTQDLLSTEAAVEIVNNSPDLYVGTVDHHYDASDSFEHNDTKQNVNSTVDDGPNSDSLHSFQSYLERVRANLEKINESASNSFVMAAALTVSGLSIGAKEALFRYTL